MTDDNYFSTKPKAKGAKWDAPALKISETDTTYLRFDILSVLPEGTTADQVAKATLRIWVQGPRSLEVKSGYCQALRVTSAWTEKALQTFFPTLSPPQGPTLDESNVLDLQQHFGPKRFICFDVTSVVRQWLSGADNFGVALRGVRLGVPHIIPPGGTGPLPPGDPLEATIDSKENTATGHLPALQIVLKSGGS